MKFSIVLAALLCACTSGSLAAAEHSQDGGDAKTIKAAGLPTDVTDEEGGVARVVWNQQPVRVALTPGSETRISFPAAIGWYDVRVPAQLLGALSIQTIDNHTFLRPMKAFAPTRVHIKARNGSAYYLLDLAAGDGVKAPRDIEFIDSTKRLGSGSPTNDDDRVATAQGKRHESPGAPEVAFTRFMAGQFYGPRRLAPALAGAYRVRIDTDGEIALIRGGANVSATPVAGWHYKNLYGVAVKLTNRSRQDYIVDPRDFRCDCRTAVAQQSLLTAAGSRATVERAANETMVYLVSDRPLYDVVSLKTDGEARR